MVGGRRSLLGWSQTDDKCKQIGERKRMKRNKQFFVTGSRFFAWIWEDLHKQRKISKIQATKPQSCYFFVQWHINAAAQYCKWSAQDTQWYVSILSMISPKMSKIHPLLLQLAPLFQNTQFWKCHKGYWYVTNTSPPANFSIHLWDHFVATLYLFPSKYV